MAEARQNWRFMLAALALGVCTAAAQPGPNQVRTARSIEVSAARVGSVAGRLTDLHSAPLGGVAVILRNTSTGAEAHAITAKNGAFHFDSLEAGTYTLEADAAQLGHGRLEGIFVSGGAEARLQLAIQLEPGAAAGIAIAAARATSGDTYATVGVSAPAGMAAPAQAPAAPLGIAASSDKSGLARASETSDRLRLASRSLPAAAERPGIAAANLPVTASIASESLRTMILTPARSGDATRTAAEPTAPASTSLRPEGVVDPVGTLITERPPDRSVRARLRIRLL
jgi:carboxypeptidase family protein